MLCDRKLNNKINRLHERALKIAHVDYVSNFAELLIIDGYDNSSTEFESINIHNRREN